MMFVLNGDFVWKHRGIHPETDPHLHLKIIFVTPRLNKNLKKTKLIIYIYILYHMLQIRKNTKSGMMGMKLSWFFPHSFFFLETSPPYSQDSPVRLGIMDFLPFSFEAAGVVPFVGGDVGCFHQKLDGTESQRTPVQ